MDIRKKGSITDLPYLISGILTVTIIALLVTLLINNLDTEVQANDIFPTESKTASTTMKDDFPNVMDGAIVFIFFGMVFVSLILASLTAIHPIFLPLYLLEWVLLIWLGAGIANVYKEIIDSAIFATEASQYTIATFFFQYFPYVVGVVGVLIAIVTYKTKRGLVE